MLSHYKFYYDESEHSRKINSKSIFASEYYDNFQVAILGWPEDREQELFEKYAAFESKYADRHPCGELKSTTLQFKRFKDGFASLNKQNAQFIEDFLSVFDENIKIYFASFSKIEYLVQQLFLDYKNTLLIDADMMKYTITKALVTYRPKEVIESAFLSEEIFLANLKAFFREKIEYNKKNLKLKRRENSAFEEVLSFLEGISAISLQEWDYRMTFEGFEKYLNEEGIADYFLLLDKEGKEGEISKTLKAAREMELNCDEEDSITSPGIRMADMMVGIFSKLLKALFNALKYHSQEENISKKILDEKWFQGLDDQKLNLYKKLQKMVCVWDHAWYKSYGGVFSDDLLSLISLLNFMSQFDSVDQMASNDGPPLNEQFNSFLCYQLQNYFSRVSHKLPEEPIPPSDKDWFENHRGAKIYYDVNRHPILPIKNGLQKFEVLSVGVCINGLSLTPMITIQENDTPVCYRLPIELSDWAYTVVGFADKGLTLFPAQVIFSKEDGQYFADIL